jgi:hypothetical protein
MENGAKGGGDAKGVLKRVVRAIGFIREYFAKRKIWILNTERLKDILDDKDKQR